jgi:hypothetical protein
VVRRNGLRVAQGVRSHFSTALSLAFGMILLACSSPVDWVGRRPTSPRPAPSMSSLQAYVLLADNRLLLVAADGTIRQVADLMHYSASDSFRSTGRFLVRSGTTLYALSASPAGSGAVAVVDVPSAHLVRLLTFGQPGIFYRGLAAAAGGTRLYLFGNRVRGPDRGPGPHGGFPLDAVVTVFDLSVGKPVVTYDARLYDGNSWYVWQGASSPDGQLLLLSYHGPDTTGIDSFRIQAGELERCATAGRANVGCIGSHGGFGVQADDVLALGAADADLAEFDFAGHELRRFNVDLPGNHLMDLTLDRSGHAFIEGSCGYAGGLSRIDIETGSVHVLRPAHSGSSGQPWANDDSICGERVAIISSSALALVHNAVPVPALIPGWLQFVSVNDGHQLAKVRLPLEALDVTSVSG